MQEIIVGENINIEDMIYEVRGVQIMLDYDLARLYECKNGAKDINKAVKRNINRFPNDFYFELTNEECSKFQFGTLNTKRGKNIKYIPHAFTEQGVAMLASVLHTKVAEQVSVNIMRAFVKMRKYIKQESNNINTINSKLLEHDIKINLLEESFDKLSEKSKINSIFFEGQIFDAYVALMEILESAKEEIIIIDNYVGIKLLNILKDIDKKIIILSSNITAEHINKYKKQYNNINFVYNTSFHDRFIIIDKKVLYHSGASFKDLGHKCFAINKIEDENIVLNILNTFDG